MGKLACFKYIHGISTLILQMILLIPQSRRKAGSMMMLVHFGAKQVTMSRNVPRTVISFTNVKAHLKSKSLERQVIPANGSTTAH